MMGFLDEAYGRVMGKSGKWDCSMEHMGMWCGEPRGGGEKREEEEEREEVSCRKGFKIGIPLFVNSHSSHSDVPGPVHLGPIQNPHEKTRERT